AAGDRRLGERHRQRGAARPRSPPAWAVAARRGRGRCRSHAAGTARAAAGVRQRAGGTEAPAGGRAAAQHREAAQDREATQDKEAPAAAQVRRVGRRTKERTMAKTKKTARKAGRKPGEVLRQTWDTALETLSTAQSRVEKQVRLLMKKNALSGKE